MEYKRPESVLVLVHTPDKVLLLRRKTPPVDIWQSVTGALRWDESPLQAARRELYEETGITDIENLLDTGIAVRFPIVPEMRCRYAPEVGENTEHRFVLALEQLCEIRLNPWEHDQYQWVTFDEATRVVWSWSNRAALETILSG